MCLLACTVLFENTYTVNLAFPVTVAFACACEERSAEVRWFFGRRFRRESEVARLQRRRVRYPRCIEIHDTPFARSAYPSKGTPMCKSPIRSRRKERRILPACKSWTSHGQTTTCSTLELHRHFALYVTLRYSMTKLQRRIPLTGSQ